MVSFSASLAALDASALAGLLEQRRDVLVEPAPRSIEELASRLDGVDSLSRALAVMDRDEVTVARAVALLDGVAVTGLAARLRADEVVVRAVVSRLCARGLAWEARGRVALPSRLAAHFAEALRAFRPVAAIAKQSRVEDLRVAVTGLGGDPSGLLKPELGRRLGELLAEQDVVAAALAGLDAQARRHLNGLLRSGGHYFMSGRPPALDGLTRSGVLVGGQYGHPELPREVASALLLAPHERITGRPKVAASSDPPDDGRACAEAAVLAVTTLLDEARRQPLAALKKGGVGTREQARLAKLGVPEPALAIDVAFAAGLLAVARPGYGVSGEYDTWRANDLPSRWGRIATVWLALDVAPTCRRTDDGEVHPPVPIASSSGLLRRALLRAASGRGSIRSAREHVEWFCPLHGYEPAHREERVAAAIREAELLGVIVGDRLSRLGEALVAATSEVELVEAVAGLLPETRGMLVVQSDLTALVSGQVSAVAARLLAACAVPESRGVAVTWRFTSASVRSALDDGWSVEELRAGLAAVSDRELPQPLDYLLGDVARRHGSVRVREVRSCITGTEAELTEIRHTRSLAKLQLTALAPTVLAGPCEIGEVITKLRAAGFSPMQENADGVVVVPERKTGPVAQARPTAKPRATVDPADLAVRLLATPAGMLHLNGTHVELSRLAVRLDAAEVALLADALEHGRDIRIRYRNKDGNHSIRDIRPQELWDRWLTSWCHLRGAEREFAVSGIESVGLPD